MQLSDLEDAIGRHSGHFYCTRINGSGEKKVVAFRHLAKPPIGSLSLLAIGRLTDFYDTFSTVVFYADQKSGEAAVRIADPVDWLGLREAFDGWFEHISDEEREEFVPSWFENCLVIGEMPRTGNYVLMPSDGDEIGRVYEFDHDGFEFTEQASDLIDYVTRLLDLDASRLTEFASHMRFIEGDHKVQWWIDEMRDNRGNLIATKP